MKIAKIIFIVALVSIFAGNKPVAAHPFYVSICQIDYNNENHALEISVKIFADDLLVALDKRKHSDIHLGEEKENPETDSYIFEYLRNKLKIKVDNTPLDYYFLGKEMEDDAVWCYLEIEDVNEFSEIYVSNSILTEIFETQNNIVQVSKEGKTKNLLLKKENITGILSF